MQFAKPLAACALLLMCSACCTTSAVPAIDPVKLRAILADPGPFPEIEPTGPLMPLNRRPAMQTSSDGKSEPGAPMKSVEPN